MHAYERQAYEMHAYEMHAYKMQAYKMQVFERHAREIDATMRCTPHEMPTPCVRP